MTKTEQDWFDRTMRAKQKGLPGPTWQTKNKGGTEQATFTDACNLHVAISTDGIDGGDGSQHELTLDFEGTSSFEVSFNDGRTFDASKIHLRFKGDAEARTMQQAAQMISQFFLKHDFHISA